MADAQSSEFEIRSTAVDFSFGEILNLHKDREIIIRPEYQRLFRWSNEQRSRLIESILLGLPIPPIFLIENEDGVLELIDGLQRISSVLQFLEHTAINEPQLTLDGCDFLKELNGKSYEQLQTVQKLKIKRSPIRATIINRTGDSFVKYEMFKRLNTGGSLLSAQEIRNCSSRMVEGGEEFYGVLQSLAIHDTFAKSIVRLPQTAREQKADEELVLRFFALYFAQDIYKGNIEEWLDAYMEKILFGKTEFQIESSSKIFRECFDTIFDKFGDQAFTRFNDNGEAIGRLAPAYFEAVCGAVSRNIEFIKSLAAEQAIARLRSAFADENFKQSTGPGANTIPKLATRIDVVTTYLKSDVDN
ncbi:MAG: DUF262 domain-containing protein [Geminicoccaceae bacterium]